MGWEDMEAAKEAGSGKFIRLKDGDEVQGIFKGQPYTFYQKFKDKGEYQTWAEGRSFKFRINFIDAETLEPRIFQGGSTLRDQLLTCKEEYGLDCVYKIKRKGSTKDDTVYSILFKRNLTSEEKEKIGAVKLEKLTSGRATKDDDIPPPDDSDQPPEDDTIPF